MRHFNPTRVRLKQIARRASAGLIGYFNPTRVRLKRRSCPPTARRETHFNPTRVRLKRDINRDITSVQQTSTPRGYV